MLIRNFILVATTALLVISSVLIVQIAHERPQPAPAPEPDQRILPRPDAAPPDRDSILPHPEPGVYRIEEPKAR